MDIIYETTTSKELQKGYRKIFNKVKDSGKPVYVITNNKIDVIIVSPKYLDDMQKQIEWEMEDYRDTMQQYEEDKKNGKLILLEKPEDLLK